MTAISLKTSLVDKISNIEDVVFLQALITIIDSKVQNHSYKFTENQTDKIEQSRTQFLKDEIVDHDVLMANVEKWLNSK